MADEKDGINSKLDNILNKLGDYIDQFVEEFTKNPVRTTIKVVAIVWFIKWVRRNLQ